MSDYEYDVVICGAGPAGSTCALTFKNSTAKVLVIDKSNFPREKVCGDGLAPYIPKILGKISEDFSKAFENFEDKFEITKFLIQSYKGNSATVELPENFYISTRYHFDNFLYEQASSLPNVTYLLEEAFQKVIDHKNYIEIITKSGKHIKAKLVIGCDGTTSIVRRSLTEFKVNAEDHWATIRAYYSGVKEVENDRFEVYFSKKYPNGYMWVFPSFNRQVNVGLGTLTSTIKLNKLDLKQMLYELIDEDPNLKRRFKNAKMVEPIKGWSIPVDFGIFPISGNRFMLCGDAGSLPDPATGEGIGPAMVSGRIAGFHALKCFEKNDYSASFMLGYDKEIEKKYGKLLRSRKNAENFYSKNTWGLDLFTSALKFRGKFKRLKKETS